MMTIPPNPPRRGIEGKSMGALLPVVNLRGCAMVKRLILAIGLLALPAQAQNVQPYVYSVTVGTSSSQVIGANQSRKSLTFHNPNDSIKVAVCPTTPSIRGGTVTPAINGAGCITLLPYDRWTVPNSSPPGSPQSVIGAAWNGIASSGGAALTIFEGE